MCAMSLLLGTTRTHMAHRFEAAFIMLLIAQQRFRDRCDQYRVYLRFEDKQTNKLFENQ